MSNQEKQDLLNRVKTYLETEGNSALDIKQELDELIQPGSSGIIQNQDIISSLKDLKISYPTKYPKYKKGDSFARYCEKFQEKVLISKKSDPNLYIYFLQNVDDETYAKLKLVNLSENQKADATSFCALYKTAIYGSQQVQLINEARDCRQESDESITDYAFKLSEKANIAHTDPVISEQECFLTFLRGVYNKNIKRKLNEAMSLNNFTEAVEYAKQLELVEKRFQEDDPISGVKSILKESAVSFSTSPNLDSRDQGTPSERVQQHEFEQNPQNSRSRQPSSSSSYSQNRSQSPYNSGRSRSRSPSSYHNSRERPHSAYYNGHNRSQLPYNNSRNRSQSPYNNSRERPHMTYNNNHSRPQSPYNDGRHHSRSQSSNNFERYHNSRTPSRTPSANYRQNYNPRNQRKNVTCWICNKKGHISTSCWHNPSKYSNNNNNNNNNRRGGYNNRNSRFDQQPVNLN